MKPFLRMRAAAAQPFNLPALGGFSMNIWTTVKRLNRRFDCWSAHEADKIVANLDRTGDGNTGDTKRYSQDTKRHISVGSSREEQTVR